VLHWVYVLAVLALAISPTDPPLRKALAIFRLTAGFGAFALHLSFDLGLIGLQSQQIVELAFTLIRKEVL
jgi:hypothetical protein